MHGAAFFWYRAGGAGQGAKSLERGGATIKPGALKSIASIITNCSLSLSLSFLLYQNIIAICRLTHPRQKFWSRQGQPHRSWLEIKCLQNISKTLSCQCLGKKNPKTKKLDAGSVPFDLFLQVLTLFPASYKKNILLSLRSNSILSNYPCYTLRYHFNNSKIEWFFQCSQTVEYHVSYCVCSLKSHIPEEWKEKKGMVVGKKKFHLWLKLAFSTLGMKYRNKVTEQVIGKTLINCTYFAVVSSKRFASF